MFAGGVPWPALWFTNQANSTKDLLVPSLGYRTGFELNDLDPGAVSNCSDWANCTFAVGNATNMFATTPQPMAFKSKHGLVLTIIFGLLAAGTSVVTILGNLLVLVSFVLDRQIRVPGNYFIASLALTDFLIGLFSMPLYTMYLLLGSNWPLGTVACDLWLSLDYTICLTSQYTVFFITLDRYCSVSYPARYRAWRSAKKLKIMVLLTWILPAFIFYVSIIGWPYFVGKRTVSPNMCYVQFMENPLFNTVLVISYYWTTLIVIFVLYVGIYRVALNMARKSQAKRKFAENVIQSGAGPTSKLKNERSIEADNKSVTEIDPEASKRHTSSKTHRRMFLLGRRSGTSSKRRAHKTSQQMKSSNSTEAPQSDETQSESENAAARKVISSKVTQSIKTFAETPEAKVEKKGKQQSSGVKTSLTSLTVGDYSEGDLKHTSSSGYSGDSPHSRTAGASSSTSPIAKRSPRVKKHQTLGWFKIKLLTRFKRVPRPQDCAPTIQIEQVPLVETHPYTRQTAPASLIQSETPMAKRVFDPSDFGGIYLGPTAEKMTQRRKKESESVEREKEVSLTARECAVNVVVSEHAQSETVVQEAETQMVPDISVASYSTALAPVTRSVSLKLQDQSLDEALSLLSSQELHTQKAELAEFSSAKPSPKPSLSDLSLCSETRPDKMSTSKASLVSSRSSPFPFAEIARSQSTAAELEAMEAIVASQLFGSSLDELEETVSLAPSSHPPTPRTFHLSRKGAGAAVDFDKTSTTSTGDVALGESAMSKSCSLTFPAGTSEEKALISNSVLMMEKLKAVDTSTQVTAAQLKVLEREKYNRAVKPPKLDIVIRAPPEALVGIRYADSESVLSFNSQDTVRILPEYMDDVSVHSSTHSTRESEPSSPIWIRRNSGHKMSTLQCLQELPEHGTLHNIQQPITTALGLEPTRESKAKRPQKLSSGKPRPSAGWHRRLKFYNRHFANFTGVEQLQISVIPAHLEEEPSPVAGEPVPALSVEPETHKHGDTKTNSPLSSITRSDSPTAASSKKYATKLPSPVADSCTTADAATALAFANDLGSPAEVSTRASLPTITEASGSQRAPIVSLAQLKGDTSSLPTTSVTTPTSPTDQPPPAHSLTTPLIAAAKPHVDILIAAVARTSAPETSIAENKEDTEQTSESKLKATSLPVSGRSRLSSHAVVLVPPSDTNSAASRQPSFFKEVRQIIRRRFTSVAVTGEEGRSAITARGLGNFLTKKRNIGQHRTKKKAENRATKALRTITFILGAFVITWTPYHVLALMKGICKDGACVDDDLYAISYWLCYVASPLNPFCYAFANKQFKKAFLRILRCDYHSY